MPRSAKLKPVLKEEPNKKSNDDIDEEDKKDNGPMFIKIELGPHFVYL